MEGAARGREGGADATPCSHAAETSPVRFGDGQKDSDGRLGHIERDRRNQHERRLDLPQHEEARNDGKICEPEGCTWYRGILVMCSLSGAVKRVRKRLLGGAKPSAY